MGFETALIFYQILPTLGKCMEISQENLCVDIGGLKGGKGRDPFNQNSDRSDRGKRTTSKGGPVFSKLFRLDRTDPLSFGPKFPEILVEWIAPKETGRGSLCWETVENFRRH